MGVGAKVMMGLGLVLLLAAAGTGWRAWRFAATAQHAMGVVVRASPDAPGDRSPGHPTVEFTTADGRTVRAFQHGGGSTPYGARLPVSYRPADPENAVTASFWTLWAVPVVLTWLGLILLVGPFFGLRPVLRS